MVGRPFVKKSLGIFAGVIFLGALYLFAWPAPLSPAAWDAPADPGYTGVYQSNQDLAGLERMDVEGLHGPEDIVARTLEGKPYIFVSAQDGIIRRISTESGDVEIVADTGGVPLGMEFDEAGNLIIADAFRGLLSVDPAGQVSILSDEADGIPVLYADDLDITPDGVIYFSDASTKFGAKAYETTLNASLYEIMESAGTGRVLAYDPNDGSTKTIMSGLVFANGVAADPEGQFILVVETGRYRIHKFWLEGPRAGQSEIIIDNLPGFPDNINRGPNGTYFVGLVSQRSPVLDDLSGKPFWRKVVWRLPEFMKPAAENYGFVFQIDRDGNVLRTWQDPEGDYPLTTGAIASGDGWLYISSLAADHVGRKPYTE